MINSKVKDCMTANPTIITPEETIIAAAKKMEKNNCDLLLVGTKNKIEGVIADRDIALRAISQCEDGKKQNVGYYMTRDVVSCQENDKLYKAIEVMQKNNVSHLVVFNEEKELVGIFAFEDIILQFSLKELFGGLDKIEKASGKNKLAS